MKKYISPTFYSVDVQSNIISASDNEDEEPVEMNLGGSTTTFDASSYRSNLWNQ